MTSALDTILCGVDESAPGQAAVQVAADLSRAAGAELVLAHVASTTPAAVHLPAGPGVGMATASAQFAHGSFLTQQELEHRAERWLADMAETAGASDAERLVLGAGDPAARLAELAEERHAGLLVVGNHGRSAAWDVLVGSVSSRLATGSPAPLLVVPPEVDGVRVPDRWAGRSLICGFDGSEASARAARAAARLAAAVGALLRLVCVLHEDDREPPSEDALREVAFAAVPDGTRLVVERAWRRGDPAEQLELVAAASDAPAIVVGTRGRGPLRSALLGSTSRRVLNAARRPVLLVPPA